MTVVYVEKWGRAPSEPHIREGFVGLDQFVRSRIIPPPIGSITFSFKTGKFTMCGLVSRIRGNTCEVLIEGTDVTIIGNPMEARGMVAHIEAEINGIPLVRAATA